MANADSRRHYFSFWKKPSNSNGLYPELEYFVLAKAASPLGPDTLAKEELQVEIRRLRERIKGLESENTTMHIKLSKTQQDVDQRLTDIEMQIGPEEPPLFVGVAAGKSANDDCPIFVGVRSATTTTTTTSGSASCSGNSGADEEEEEEDEKNRESFI